MTNLLYNRKPVFIFLFLSMPLMLWGVYCFAYKRTNGNVSQSILFVLYFLGMKLGLIELNPKEFDEPQLEREPIHILI